jgi:hypothetical protein
MIEAILYIEKRSNPGKFDAGMEMTAEQYVIALKNGAMLFDPEDKLDDILNGRHRTVSGEHAVSRKEKPAEEISCRALIDEVMGTATIFMGDRNYVDFMDEFENQTYVGGGCVELHALPVTEPNTVLYPLMDARLVSDGVIHFTNKPFINRNKIK